MDANRLIFLLAGGAAAAIWASWSFFSRDARLQRRRRKSHSRVVSKHNRPMVRFNLRRPKK
jgi:hypothetical protein